MAEHPPFLNTVQAAAFLGVSVSSMTHWRSYGKGPPFYRMGSLIRYSQSDLLAWQESQPKVEPSDAPTSVS